MHNLSQQILKTCMESNITPFILQMRKQVQGAYAS